MHTHSWPTVPVDTSSWNGAVWIAATLWRRTPHHTHTLVVYRPVALMSAETAPDIAALALQHPEDMYPLDRLYTDSHTLHCCPLCGGLLLAHMITTGNRVGSLAFVSGASPWQCPACDHKVLDAAPRIPTAHERMELEHALSNTLRTWTAHV